MKKVFLVTVPDKPNCPPKRFVTDSVAGLGDEYSAFMVESIDFKENPINIFDGVSDR